MAIVLRESMLMLDDNTVADEVCGCLWSSSALEPSSLDCDGAAMGRI